MEKWIKILIAKVYNMTQKEVVICQEIQNPHCRNIEKLVVWSNEWLFIL